MPPQPSNEQFENTIAWQWKTFSRDTPIWIEDESRCIGQCKIPDPLFSLMQCSPLTLIEKPLEERLKRLYADYAGQDHKLFIEATRRIEKKLGGARTKEIIGYVHAGKMPKAIERILKYYDSTYHYSINRRQQQPQILSHSCLSDEEWVTRLLSNPGLPPIFPFSAAD